MAIVDSDVKIIAANNAACELLALNRPPDAPAGAGDVLGCVNFKDRGCGQGEFCKDRVVRNTVTDILKSKDKTLRRKTRIKLLVKDHLVIIDLSRALCPERMKRLYGDPADGSGGRS